ncbi:Acid-sensing ion channel 1 [Mizuhopecten yessoensis]|uniref:Acid-sensing ion channel 1 n=1 Tax=Mizuhopecten yessoensis TaxID=6573 RepID=A0A210Q8W8_MIZYE|nr:Acid-sensing ion channel 1 [Mizuhopecten yessoensis]
MKKIKVKPSVNTIVRKLSSQKKLSKKPSMTSDEPPVYSVMSPPHPPPQTTLISLEYGTEVIVAPTSEKPPLQENASEGKSSPFLPDTNVQTLWHSFRSNTTMHGLKYARKRNGACDMTLKHSRKKVIWVIALLCMGGLLIYTCVDLFKKYTQHTTMSNIKVELVNQLPFPAITFCNLSPYKKSGLKPDPVMEHYLLTLSRMKDFVSPIDYDHPWYSNLSLPLPEGWLHNVSYSILDMFGACVDMKDVMNNCMTVLTPTLTDIGLCYTFNSKEYIREHEALITTITGSTKSLAFYIHVNQDEYVYNDNMAAGMKIVVHDPDEEPDTDKGFFTSPGFSSYASLQLTKYKYMPYPYQSSGGGYCLDTESSDFKNPLEYHDTYSRKACLRECKYRYLVSTCGCQAPTDIGEYLWLLRPLRHW